MPGPASSTAAFDEARFASGATRPEYRGLLRALEGADLADLRARADAVVAEQGVTFGEATFAVDPIPRLLDGREWDALAAGLRQRVRALGAFVADAYGPRRIVAAGLMPGEAIDSAEGFEPELMGRWPTNGPSGWIAGLDVVREPSGRMVVLEDNLRSPSGFTYATAARLAVEAVSPVSPPAGAPGALLVAALRRTLRGAAARIRTGEPSIVVLTESGAAGFEHETVASWLGVPLVGLEDLVVRDGDVCFPDADGRLRRVDVVYRRTDTEALRDSTGAPTEVARALLEPWLNGRVAVVNPFGTGVADDKLTHTFVEDMIRFYLGEEPRLASVPTLDLTRGEHRDRVLADLRSYVVKPRLGHGGRGIVVCAHADEADLGKVARDLRAHPQDFVAQPMVALSTHPTVVEGGLEPRHVDLRPYVFASDAGVFVPEAALTRVAWGAGALVVNSSQDGGAKDTWVLR
jgi:uncharacterized circularly permuted ATP-grasp superfamily protein